MVAMIMEYRDTDARVPPTPCRGVTAEFLSPHMCSMLSPMSSHLTEPNSSPHLLHLLSNLNALCFNLILLIILGNISGPDWAGGIHLTPSIYLVSNMEAADI